MRSRDAKDTGEGTMLDPNLARPRLKEGLVPADTGMYLRIESGVTDRVACTRAIDELQAAMIVVPSEVVYLPKFTYLWTLGVGRFPDALRQRVNRQTALREIARSFLAGAGMTIPGELARVTGLSRPDAGLGNRALVAEGYATMLAPGMYQLAPGVNGGDGDNGSTRSNGETENRF